MAPIGPNHCRCSNLRDCFKVVLKIIKHCQDERSAGEVVQGVLLGLIQNNKLEITNCFPFPSSRAGDDDDEDDGERLS